MSLLLQDPLLHKEPIPTRVLGIDSSIKLPSALSKEWSQYQKCQEVGRWSEFKNVQLPILARLNIADQPFDQVCECDQS